MTNFEYRGFECEHIENGYKLHRKGLTITVNIHSAKELIEYIDECL